MPDIQPISVARIDKSILQTIGRLSYGTWITSRDSGVLAPFHHGVPSAFLFIEFWRIAMGFERGGALAWDNILKSLERRKLFATESRFLFVPNGVFVSQDEEKWVIEQRCVERPIYAGGELVTTGSARKLFCYLQSGGNDAAEGLQRESKGSLNLYTPAGMRLDMINHPHHLLTDEGWRLADLAVSDFVDDLPASPEHASGIANASNDGDHRNLNPQPVPNRPSDDAFKAWRLRDLTGLRTQNEIAATMSKELGRRVHQGEVSRWLNDVDGYRKANGVFPDLPKLTAKPQSIDPAIQDMGERQDHRTPRQRPRPDDSQDD